VFAQQKLFSCASSNLSFAFASCSFRFLIDVDEDYKKCILFAVFCVMALMILTVWASPLQLKLSLSFFITKVGVWCEIVSTCYSKAT